jgi:hypothetical protein
MLRLDLSSRDQVILAYACWYSSGKNQECRRAEDVANLAELPEEGKYEVVFRDHTGNRPHPAYVKLPGRRARELFCSSVVAWRTDAPVGKSEKYILGHNFIVIEANARVQRPMPKLLRRELKV